MHRMARGPVPGKAQEGVAKAEPPIAAAEFGNRSWESCLRRAVQHRGATLQDILERMTPRKAHEGEGLACAGHSHVVQPPGGVPILTFANAVPRAVQHDNVDTIAAFAEDMSDFLMTSEITESRAFIKSFVKEIKVKPGKATVYYTIPISQSTTKTEALMGGGLGCRWEWWNWSWRLIP